MFKLRRISIHTKKIKGGGNVTFSVKKITGSHIRRNFKDNDLIFFLDSQN